MAHGWNSYYHNLPPMSSDPGSSRRTSDTEGTLPNFIGQEFSNPVTSHDHITNSNYCTNYYPSTGIANSSSDCVYQRYSGETRWQAEQQTGKGFLQKCAKSDMPDIPTGGLQSSEFQDLGFKQQCELADASFLENYSDVSSGSDETKPSCDYVAGNLLPKSKMDLPPENTCSDWISSHTGSMTYPTVGTAGLETDSIMPTENTVWTQSKMDSPGNTVESSTENGQSVAPSCITAAKCDTVPIQNDHDGKQDKEIRNITQEKCSDISTSEHENVIGDQIAASADDNAGTMTISPPTDERDLPDQKVMEKKLHSENHEVEHLNYKVDKDNMSNEEKPKSEVLKKEKDVLGSLKNEILNSHPSHEIVINPSEGNLLANVSGMDTDVSQHESIVEKTTKDSLSQESSDTCESVSKGIPASENQGLSNCFESSSPLHNSDANDDHHPGNELAGEEQKTGETAKTDSSEPSFTNDSPAKHTAGMDISQEKKMTSSSEQNTTTSSADQNDCSSSDKNEQDVDLPESSLQPVTPDSNEIGISKAPEGASPEPEPDGISSFVTSDDSGPSAFKTLETCLQLKASSTDVPSCSEMEWTEQGPNPNTSPLTDQQDVLSEKTDAVETLSPCEGVAENAQESFEEMNISTEEPSLSDTPYGEPLSREDSSCDPDETALDASRNDDGEEDNGEFHSEPQEPQLKFSVPSKTILHPVVMLKKFEPTDGQSHVYHCAECSHATSNVDGLIAHHHCSHAMVDIQFCKTCHLYQIGEEQAKKHVCGVIGEHMEISANKEDQKETKLGRHKCNVCRKRFARIMHFVQHMRTHTGKTPFRCNGCGLYFSQSCSLNRHKRVPGRCKLSKLSENKSDTVGSKNQMPSQKDGVENDQRANIQECYVKLVDIARTTQCYICGKRYPSVAKANKHRYAVHNMKSVSMLLKHFVIKTKSDMNKKYKCPLCPRLFKYTYNRARHLRDCVRNAVYNGKGKVNGNYRCPLCYTSFSLPHNRYRHLKSFCLRETLNRLAKENEKPIKQKTDKKPKILVQDDKQKTQPEENEQKKHTIPNSTAKPEPRYKCGLCPAVFHHPSGKYKHKKKHELYQVSGKIIRYRKSIFSAMSMPTVSSSKKTEEEKNDRKDSLISTEESNPVTLKCHFCDKCFGTSRSLKKHQVRHRGEKPFHCLDCGKRFKKRCYLVGHRTVHQKKIQCTICRKILPTIGELIQHRKILHPKKGLLKCPECPQEFQYPVYLLRHFVVHQNKENKPSQLERAPSVKPQQSLELKEQTKSNLECSLCKEEFDDAQALRKHCLTHISGSSSNHCPFCERPFSCRQYLLRHMLQHTGNKAFSCTNCGKQFYRLMFLKLHSEKCLPLTNQLPTTKPTKTKRPYICSLCPRSFSKKIRLKSHLIAHKKNTLQQCSNCGGLYGINRLSIHLKDCLETTKNDGGSSLPSGSSTKCTSHTVKDENEKPLQSSTRKVLPLKCPHCPKRFKFKSVQLRHLVSHTGLQPYACAHCNKRFGTQNMRALHENLCDGISNVGLLKPKSDAVEDPPNMPPVEKTADHSQTDDEAEYKCKFCTKTFMKPRSLRRHILTHNEVKPYRCKACDGCFSRHDHLKVHQARCKGRKRRLEVCIPKISLDDVGRGWQMKFGIDASDKKDTFDCEFCTRTFPTQSKLSRHVTISHSTKLFKCSRCGAAFSHEKSLKKHRKVNKCRRPSMQVSVVPPDDTDLAAENATGQLGRMSRVLARIQPSSNKKHKFGCTYCPRVFTNGSHLDVHIRLHTGERPYSCDYCGQKFVRKDYVQRHYQKCAMKRQQSKVLCDDCGSFFPANKLENHKKSCTATSGSSASMAKRTRQSTSDSPPKGFSCAYCSKRFLLFSQLQEHFLASHKVETMEPLTSTAPLQQHLSNMPNSKGETGDESCDEVPNDDAVSASEPSSPLQSKVPEKFFCFECNTSFANKAGLKGHQRTHQNPNPITCKICNKKFGNRALLRNHYRKCKKLNIATKQREGPLKATLDFAVNDSVLVFKEKSETTGSGVLQTNFSCKNNLTDESSQDSEGSQVPSSSTKEKKEVQYQCSECDQTFTDGLLLISHLEDHGRKEQEKKRNTCTRCGRVCSNQANLEKHMKMHGISKKFPCPKCSKSFFTFADLEDHKTCHDPSRPYCCKLCFQRFLTRPSLCSHYSEEHVDDAFTCQFCSKTYAAKKSLVRHYKKWHPQEQRESKSTRHEKGNDSQNPNSKVSTSGESEKEDNSGDEGSDPDLAPYFPCHVCGKTFTTSENLEDHQLCHLGEKPHECAECGKCFFQASQLQQHRRKHQSEFQCPTCGKGFLSRFALRKHKQGHIKIHPFRCSRCHLTFKCQAQLTEHMYTHREDNFPCDICNQVFVSKSSRAEHRKSHTVFEDRPLPPVSRAEKEPPTQNSESSLGYSTEFKYRCGVCHKRFRDPEKLSEHGCMAAKERPYSCTDCDKHFLHASHLKKHRKTHLPTRSDSEYPCKQCNNTFYSTKDFLGHLNNPDDIVVEIKRESDDEGEGPIPTYICPVCHKCFPSGIELIYHFPTHPDGAYKCEKRVPPKNKVEDYGGSSQAPAGAVKCTDCGLNFSGDDAFCRHNCSRQRQAAAETSSSKRSSGTYCRRGEEEEVDVTGEELYNCPACSKRFTSKSRLLEHQNMDHSDGKPFKCEICGRSFAKKRYLTKHKYIHKQKVAVSHTPQPPKTVLNCPRCNARFSTKQDLSEHMRLHAENEVGEYRCDMCYKSFNLWSLLRQHQESHVGEVVYECTECDKAFAFPHLLEEHQQTHAGSSR